MNNTNNFIIFNKWIDFNYAMKNKLLSPKQISNALDLLYTHLTHIPVDTPLMIQFKIKIGKEWRSVSYLQTILVRTIN